MKNIFSQLCWDNYNNFYLINNLYFDFTCEVKVGCGKKLYDYIIDICFFKDIFELVSQQVSSSGNYLVGNCFSVADLTFAALASPVLRPENHPIYSSNIQQVHPERLKIVEQLRKTQAGQFALNLYRQYRTTS